MTDLTAAELVAVAEAMSSAGTPTGELSATKIAGGRSNLTYVVTDGTGRWVLRTPPRHGRTQSAHDVAREHRVTSALHGTGVPVARPVLLHEGDDLLGVPFTVCEYVEGRAYRTQDDLAELGTDLEATVQSLMATLAALHRVDHVAVGLERFGRPDGYAARQVSRWTRQWQEVGTRELGALADEVATGLAKDIPEQSAVSLVHGDYRLDNTLIQGTQVAAVVDWELSTVGDPVADVAVMSAYREPAFDLVVGAPSSWTSDALPEPDELAASYLEQGGFPLQDWEFHRALAAFKVAVIAAGIDHRRRAGAASGPGFDTAGQAVEPYLELAKTSLG